MLPQRGLCFTFQRCWKKSRSCHQSQCDKQTLPLYCCPAEWTWRHMSCSAICVYLLAFWASILHRVYGSAASLTQFHSHICEICGKHTDNSEIGNCQFSRVLLLTFSTRLSCMTDLCPLRSSSRMFVWPSLKCLNHCDTFPSLIALGP